MKRSSHIKNNLTLRLDKLSSFAERKLFDSPEFKSIKANYELELHMMIEFEIQKGELQKTSDELEVVKSQYNNIYEQAPIGCLTLDMQGIIIKSNEYISSLLGVEKNLLNKRHLSDFIAPDDKIIYREYCKSFAEEKYNKNCEVRLLLANGDSILVVLKKSLIHDKINENNSFLVTIFDLYSNEKQIYDFSHIKLNSKLSKLSKREKEVLNLVLKGLSNKEIALLLSIKSRTVELHRSNILSKTGVKNFLQLTIHPSNILS